jgi:hypothetical protein
MDDTLVNVAMWLGALLVLLALLYGVWRAIRSPLQPLATFIRAWSVAFTVVRLERRLSLLILAAFTLGQSLQVGFHFFRVLNPKALAIVSQIWQFCLAVFLALCAARILLRVLPKVTFRPANFAADTRGKQIAAPVALWAAAVWLIGFALTVLGNFTIIHTAPYWRWYVAAPAPMLLYLLQTPLILIRPALVFGRTGSDGIGVASRHLPALLLLNLMFTLPPLLFPLVVFILTSVSHISPFSAYLISLIVNVPFILLQFLAYELAMLIAFGVATNLAPRIRFNRTFSTFYPS